MHEEQHQSTTLRTMIHKTSARGISQTISQSGALRCRLGTDPDSSQTLSEIIVDDSLARFRKAFFVGLLYKDNLLFVYSAALRLEPQSCEKQSSRQTATEEFSIGVSLLVIASHYTEESSVDARFTTASRSVP